MSILLMIPQDHSKLPCSRGPYSTRRDEPYGASELVFPFVIFLMTYTRVHTAYSMKTQLYTIRTKDQDTFTRQTRQRTHRKTQNESYARGKTVNTYTPFFLLGEIKSWLKKISHLFTVIFSSIKNFVFFINEHKCVI